MAGYRQIHTQIWKDDWFIDLDPDGKLLFIYLFSNELSSISGLYKIPIRVMHNETGLPIDVIEKLLSEFGDHNKVIYDNGIVWIPAMWKYHKNASPKTMTKVKNDIDLIPDCELKSVCIQYIYSIDTNPHKDKDKDKDKNKDKPENDDDDNLSSRILSTTFEEKSGILMHNPPKWIEALDMMEKQGVEAIDITNAVDKLREKNYTIVGLWSIQNAAISCMGDRKRNGKQKESAESEMERRIKRYKPA